jgi:paraquat-inducible protein B
MSIRLRDTVRAVAESAGIIAPNVQDAQTAAEQRRRDLVAAQVATATAEDELNRLDDRGDATGAQVMAAEAELANVKITAERAQRAYSSAEKRLTAARDAESEKAKGAMRERFKKAMETRTTVAAEIDRLAAAMGEQKRLLDEQDVVIGEAARVGVAAREATVVCGRAERCIELALSKHGVIARSYMGDPTQHPGAVELVSRDNAALAAV